MNTNASSPTDQRPQPRYEVVNFNALPANPCLCGTARRAFLDAEDFPGTVHRTDISVAAVPHFHKRQTEIYYILQCDADARMQLDEEEVPVEVGTCIRIPPGVVHRAIGEMQVLIVCLPKYDPDDEYPVEKTAS